MNNIFTCFYGISHALEAFHPLTYTLLCLHNKGVGIFMENNDRLTKLWVVFLLAMLSCFLWGSATPSIKTGYEIFSIASSDTWAIIQFAGIRFFLAGILVILFESLKEKKFVKPEKAALPSIVKLGFAQTIIQYFCFYIGLAHTSGVTGTILSGSGGFFSILMACFLFRQEKMTTNKMVGVILGFAGIIIMNISFSGGSMFTFTLPGEGLVLLSQISYALSGILVKRYSVKFNVVMLSGYQFIFGGLVMVLVSLIAGARIDMAVGIAGYVLLIYMALISAVAYTVWGILMKHNPVSRVSIFNFMTPLFGVLLSAIFLNEVEQALQINKLLALILVSLGIFIVNRKSAESTK